MTPPARPTVVRPFRALHYDPTRVTIADVVSPPYDVIDERRRAQLLASSPYNVVRLILPEPGREDEAAALLDRWQAEGVLVTDDEPGLYWVEQEYTGPDGVTRRREGFIGLVRVEPYEARVVRPHERTHAAPKEGRLRLLRATEAQLSPVFALYRDPHGRAEAALREARVGTPDIDVADQEGTRHRMWRVPGDHAAVREALAASPLLIADGHHRYETALAYREERRAHGEDDAGADWTMMYLVNADSEGLTIFPTHRVVTGLDAGLEADLPRALREGGLTVSEISGDVRDLLEALEGTRGVPAFGVWRGGSRPGLLCLLEDAERMRSALPAGSDATRTLDVAVVEALVLGPVLGLATADVAATDRLRYAHRAEDAARLASEAGTIAVILRPPSIEAVEAVVEAGETMPQKSTYFFPKTVDGFVFHRLSGPSAAPPS